MAPFPRVVLAVGVELSPLVVVTPPVVPPLKVTPESPLFPPDDPNEVATDESPLD